MPQCPHQALQIVDGKVVWNAAVCEQCDICLKRCPQHATPMAQSMSVDEVLSHVRKAVLFIEGITVSGGEATTQLPFVSGAVYCYQKRSATAPSHLSGGQ